MIEANREKSEAEHVFSTQKTDTATVAMIQVATITNTVSAITNNVFMSHNIVLMSHSSV